MVKLEEAVIARLGCSGHKFEILVEPNLAMDLKHGANVDFSELLATDLVYKDVGKGEKQSEHLLEETFGTCDIKEIARRIIADGTVQLTTEQKRKLKEKKEREIIDYISKNAINPQTNAPHPPARIETAIKETGLHVDAMKSVSEQVPVIVKELKKMLPLSMEKMRVAVKIPAQYSGKALSMLHQFGLKKEEWQSNGSIIAVLEIPAGLKGELIDKVNKASGGEADVKVLKE